MSSSEDSPKRLRVRSRTPSNHGDLSPGTPLQDEPSEYGRLSIATEGAVTGIQSSTSVLPSEEMTTSYALSDEEKSAAQILMSLARAGPLHSTPISRGFSSVLDQPGDPSSLVQEEGFGNIRPMSSLSRSMFTSQQGAESTESSTLPYGSFVGWAELLPPPVSKHYLDNWQHFKGTTLDALDFISVHNSVIDMKFCFSAAPSLGTGAYASVFKAVTVDSMNTDNPRYVAIKKTDSNSYIFALERERQVLTTLVNHPHENIISCLQMWKSGIQNIERYYMAMEFSPIGDLFNVLKVEVNGTPQWMPLKEHFCRHLIRGIAEGVRHLFNLGIAHGDIKPENVLLFWTSDEPVGEENQIMAMTPKLADFNQSSLGPPNGPILCNRPRCTETTAAPEAWFNPNPYDMVAADVYSVGSNLIAMLTGCYPFWPPKEFFNPQALPVLHSNQFDPFGRNDQFRELSPIEFSKYLKCDTHFLNRLVETFEPDLRDLLLRTLAPHAINRITIEQFLNHQWFASD